MRGWQFISARNPLWRVLGLAGILVTSWASPPSTSSAGPGPCSPTDDAGVLAGAGTQGRFGTVTEPLGDGPVRPVLRNHHRARRRTCSCRRSTGQLQEPQTTWNMDSPSARKAEGVWTLFGPMDLDAVSPGRQRPAGQRHHQRPGPGPGLGPGRLARPGAPGVGRPPGQRPGPLEPAARAGTGAWMANSWWTRARCAGWPPSPGAVKTMDAQRMWAALGFKEGHLEDVHRPAGRAARSRPRWWTSSRPGSAGPPRSPSARDDGWHGTAVRRPGPPAPGRRPFEKMEFSDFRAQRAIPGGTESVQLQGRPVDPGRAAPGGGRAPGAAPGRATGCCCRRPGCSSATRPGPDLPGRSCPVGETWAEAQAVLSWGNRSLTSPRIEGAPEDPPVADPGPGPGPRARWAPSAPARAGATRPGGPSTAPSWPTSATAPRPRPTPWSGRTTGYTLTGRPVTVTRFRERLTGPRSGAHRATLLEFPAGLAGALAALDGDINLQADRGRALRDRHQPGRPGGVPGAGLELASGPYLGNAGAREHGETGEADGAVFLRGRMGEGRGDTLYLDPNQKTANWIGPGQGHHGGQAVTAADGTAPGGQEPLQALRRPHRGAGRVPGGVARGGGGPAGAQRGRQDHHVLHGGGGGGPGPGHHPVVGPGHHRHAHAPPGPQGDRLPAPGVQRVPGPDRVGEPHGPGRAPAHPPGRAGGPVRKAHGRLPPWAKSRPPWA